ncbi:LytTR family DNA-binding domain-containing protein [Companilactobacillus jidongensis]|uniref:LytTR family DNA-binding domain-containing protein n=1 Tax=Companilactobacillus jidongensis TaxID=2486006 RepID=UPI0013DDB1C4|nr:LytTR family DNA-binding domain-containing protein [Companilactobacillus jidongensis]
MKIRVDVSSDYPEKEIVIKSPSDDDELKNLVKQIKKLQNEFSQLNGYVGETVYSLELKNILFFETNDRNVYAHTTNNAFLIHHRLYELEEKLPDNFLRISKSSILNLDEISSLTRSVTGNLVQFKNTYKTLYVSRRFLKELKNRLDKKEF